MPTAKLLKKKITIDGVKHVVSIKRLDADRAQVKAIEDGDELGTIEGYASVFGNVDSYGDIVEAGAFDRAIADFNARKRYPKLVYHHDWSRLLGPVLELSKDTYGLRFKGRLLPEVQDAREAYALIKSGALTDLSFGYEVNDYEIDRNTGIRRLKEITIYEISPVMVGANAEAAITAFKSADGGVLEEEDVEVSEAAAALEGQDLPAATQEAPGATETPEGGESQPAPETPAEEPQAPAGEPASPVVDTPPGQTPQDTPPSDPEAPVEVKEGRVLSAANIAKIRAGMERITAIRDGIKDFDAELADIFNGFEALIGAVEDPEKSGHQPVDPRGKGMAKLILKDARAAVKANIRVIRAIKQNA